MTQRMDYMTVSAAGMKALGGVHGYIANSGLPPALIDLLKPGRGRLPDRTRTR